jgi:hypothetical protein
MREKTIKTHKDLDVWNKAMEFAEKIYQLTKDFPKNEQFGLSLITHHSLRKLDVS